MCGDSFSLFVFVKTSGFFFQGANEKNSEIEPKNCKNEVFNECHIHIITL